MKTADMIPVLMGQKELVSAVYPTPQEARAARNRAGVLLRAFKDRNCYGMNPPYRPTIERLHGVKVYILPEDPCRVICGMKPEPHVGGPYKRVLSLAVGQSCVISVRGTSLETVASRLKALASEVEEALGVRPCWRASYVESLDYGLNLFRITRLPDDHDPVTGLKRETPTGRRLDLIKAEWAAYARAFYAYEADCARAGERGEPRPEPPPELLDMAARLRPADVPYLLGEATPEEEETAPC